MILIFFLFLTNILALQNIFLQISLLTWYGGLGDYLLFV